MDNFTDSSGNKQVKIVNPDELENKLENINISLTLEEFQSSINKFNSYMADPNNNIVKETSDNVAKEIQEEQAQNTGGISTAAISCSKALTVIGWVHSGSYAAAAYALGLTGGASVAIPILVSAAYGAASLACD